MTTYHHQLFHLCVSSDTPLKELQTLACPPQDDDLIIRVAKGVVPESLPGDLPVNSIESYEEAGIENSLQVSADEVLMTVSGLGAFHIRAGREIIWRADTTDQYRVDNFLVSMCLSSLMVQRGYVVVHSSAVKLNDSTVVFLGDSGAGKSTTAAAFARAGCQVVSDDVSVISPPPEPKIWAALPFVRLLPDAFGEFQPHLGGEDVLREGVDKHLVDVTNGKSCQGPESLGHLCVLEWGDELSIEPITGAARLMAFVSSSAWFITVYEETLQRQNFERCGSVATSVPCWRLTRPRDFSKMPDMVALALETMRDHP